MPKQVIISLGLMDGNDVPSVEEWHLTVQDGLFATYLGVELVTEKSEENPSGRLTITRVPFAVREEERMKNEFGDVQCPNDGEWVNIRCWKCDWRNPVKIPVLYVPR